MVRFCLGISRMSTIVVDGVYGCRAVPSPYPHLPDLPERKTFDPGLLPRALRDKQGRAIFLVELLQPGREVDVIAVHGIPKQVTGPHQSANDYPGVDADPGAKLQAVAKSPAQQYVPDL